MSMKRFEVQDLQYMPRSTRIFEHSLKVSRNALKLAQV